MKKFIKAAVLLSLIVFSGNVRAQSKKSDKQPPPQTVGSVNLKRYAGKWFEVARYPNKFQKSCVANTTATYTIKADNSIELLSECLVKNGTLNSARGAAKLGGDASNAKFEMSFAPQYKSFVSNEWRDFWIVDLDADYTYAAVGDPQREHLSILSRTPQMSDATYQNILRRVEKLGYNPARLQKTQQNAEVIKGAVVEKQ